MGVLDDVAAINDGGLNTAAEVRAALTSVLNAASENVALLKPVTHSVSPHPSYPNTTIIKNGSAFTGVLTAPGAHSAEAEGFSSNRLIGWSSSQHSGSEFWIKVDLENPVLVHKVVVWGYYRTSDQIFHPVASDVEVSLDDSAWSPFSAALSSMSSDPNSENTAHWALEFSDDLVSARYVRVNLTPGGTSDNWIMLSRLMVMGSKEIS